MTLTLTFTTKEIIESLEKLGYEIKTEEVLQYLSITGIDGTVPTQMAYYGGVCVTDSGYYSGLYYEERITRLFEKELIKKLLELF